jgi:hypothetical protein
MKARRPIVTTVWHPGGHDIRPNEVEISVVKYGDAFAFLGLYMVHPISAARDMAGRSGMPASHLPNGRSIGLDGVAAQQDNYRKAGFEPAYKTVRYGGVIRRCRNRRWSRSMRFPTSSTGCSATMRASFPAAPAFVAAWCTSSQASPHGCRAQERQDPRLRHDPPLL